MKPIRVCIADDDAGMRLLLRTVLERSGGFELAGEAEDGEAMIALCAREKPQLAMMDVEMPKCTGVECARVLQDIDPKLMVIFITAHEGYMADAFSVYAFDYLLKPFRTERALQTLERVKEAAEIRERAERAERGSGRAAAGRLMLRHRDGVSFLNQEDILLVQREDRATVIYAKNEGRYVVTDTLREIEERLDPSVFFRCHKSYIINVDEIDNILPNGHWTYIVRLRGTKQDALITHDNYEELEKMFSGG